MVYTINIASSALRKTVYSYAHRLLNKISVVFCKKVNTPQISTERLKRDEVKTLHV